MSFDCFWWSVPNETWVSYYKNKHPDLTVKALFDNNAFAKMGCVIAYPIAGAFTKFLMDSFGIERYLDFYKYKGCEYSEAVQTIFGVSLLDLELSFWQEMQAIVYDEKLLEKILKDEGF